MTTFKEFWSMFENHDPSFSDEDVFYGILEDAVYEATNPALPQVGSKVLLSDERVDYLKRLIIGVREIAEKEKQKKCGGEDIILGEYVDALLLCDVVEEEILMVT